MSEGFPSYEGDFCYCLPARIFGRAKSNEEKNMKTDNRSLQQIRGKPAVRRGRATSSPDSSSAEFDSPREQMIAEAAYFRAEQRGFEPGNEMSDWLEAEADVEHLLNDRQ